MLEPNAVLQDRYVISKPLAKGGMGAVYMAVDRRLKVNIALKETLFSDETLCKAFEREARLLANLRHNLLPKVIDHFTEGSKQYIVMEFIPGEDLSTLIKQQGRPFSVEDVLKWADQLLDLLDYMHNQEPAVIHRDIKPQNLKLTPRGEIVLLDFGLAKGQPSTINVTASIRAVATSLHGYTLNYSPPEQIEGTGTDPRSDLYALGATLYHLLTGAAPLDSVTRSLKILDSYPDPLIPASELNREVPKVLSNVLSKAMAIDKTARYQAATEMRDSLRKIYRADTANSQINSQGFQIRTPSSLHLQPTPKLSSTTFMAGHTGYIRSLAFSSDGQYVVSGSEDKTVRLWDANSFSELARYTGHGDWVTSVAFSPD
ncbi:MAG: protein kinase, partial [Blastocatellia bacterium]|nr:protein kinase [Blastocatellia bacterium]